MAGKISISLDEAATGNDVCDLLNISGDNWSTDMLSDLLIDDGSPLYEQGIARESSYLDHPVFHSHRSETSMMRYLNSLASKDVSLTTSMISSVHVQ